MKDFRYIYDKYKEEINEKDNLDDLEFERIKLEQKINIVNHPVLYLTMVISVFSIALSILKDEKPDMLALGMCMICIVVTLILLVINEVRSSQNKTVKYKIEIIKLRIQKLKDEELNKKRKMELDKILKQENKNDDYIYNIIVKIIKFLRIK